MKKFVIVILIVMLLFNGLINERELNKLAIVSCIGIDISESGQYQVTVNILNTKKVGESSAQGTSEKELSSVNMYYAEAKSLQEAFREIIKQSPKRLYLAHVKVVMLSESLAKEDIMDTLDYFIRDYEGGNNFILTVVKDKSPKYVMEKLSKKYSDFATEIMDSIISSHKYRGNTTNDILNDDLRLVLEEGQELVLDVIELEEIKKEKSEENGESAESGQNIENEQGSKENSNENSDEEKQYVVKISEMAYFKQNKMKDYLDADDAITYNLLKNELITTIIELDEKENRIVAEIISAKSSMKPDIVNGKYIVNVKASINCNITELGKNIMIENEQDLENIEEKLKKRMEEHISSYIDNCKNKYDSDVVGIGNLFYKYKYDKYSKISDKFYEEIYDNIEINMDVEVKIPNMGGVKKSW